MTEEKRAEGPEDSSWAEWAALAVKAMCWAIFLFAFVFQFSDVDGSSMSPTFLNGDRVLVDKVTYRFSAVRRYDVVVFRLTDLAKSEKRELDYIKRVIGMPGETVQVLDGKIYVNGVALPEDTQIASDVARFDTRDSFQYVVPKGHFMVMGDNRNNSNDSRTRTFGFVPANQIRGIVRFRYRFDRVLRN